MNKLTLLKILMLSSIAGIIWSLFYGYAQNNNFDSLVIASGYAFESLINNFKDINFLINNYISIYFYISVAFFLLFAKWHSSASKKENKADY